MKWAMIDRWIDNLFVFKEEICSLGLKKEGHFFKLHINLINSSGRD